MPHSCNPTSYKYPIEYLAAEEYLLSHGEPSPGAPPPKEGFHARFLTPAADAAGGTGRDGPARHRPGPGFDRLAGKSANELYSELKEFQSGKEGNGIMAKHAMGFTDAQLRALADWLSKQPR